MGGIDTTPRRLLVTLDGNILERLEKILALTNNPNPYQAAVAAAKFSELLDKHGLSTFDVDNWSPERIKRNLEESIVEERIFPDYRDPTLGQMPFWKEHLVKVVAKHHGIHCHVIVRKYKIPASRTFVLAGEKIHVAAVTALYKWLVTQLEIAFHRSANEDPEAPRNCDDPVDLDTFRAGFLRGAIDVIEKRFSALHAARPKASTALVRIMDEAVSGYVAEKYPNLQEGRLDSTIHDVGALKAGRRAGSQVDIGVTRIRPDGEVNHPRPRAEIRLGEPRPRGCE